ncbi:uncharacterized protein LOC113552659 [Rhopalosiphum maidis]|uniref:uncharacterized protein LOC113552659 n=1 Tax=Rhopalosiphum maidis TaxID=43146 RepID=UPI000F00BED5|nr:uncharacterized protein LOC113552659 [Rhopalosiphum maidis]
MNQHQQLLFLLGVVCLTTADVLSSTKENLDTEIISSREVSRSELPPQSEPLSQVKLPLRDEPSSQNQLSTRTQHTTRIENSSRIPCSSSSIRNEDVNECTVPASTTVSVASVTNGLRDRVIQLTNELSKAVAAMNIAQQRERKLAVLEREKYNYVKAASEKVLGLVDNVRHAENVQAADTYRERQVQQRLARTHRTLGRSRRRLQVIHRLLAGAEVGLVHLESSKMLSKCSADSMKPQDTQHSAKSPSLNHALDV